MAQLEFVQRLLDAGADFTQMTQRNAERLVKSLVDAGDVQASQAQQAARDLVEQSRKNRERLLAVVDREVQAQISRMGLATRADVDRLEKKVSALQRATKQPAKKTVKKKAKAKAPAKKS